MWKSHIKNTKAVFIITVFDILLLEVSRYYHKPSVVQEKKGLRFQYETKNILVWVDITWKVAVLQN